MAAAVDIRPRSDRVSGRNHRREPALTLADGLAIPLDGSAVPALVWLPAAAWPLVVVGFAVVAGPDALSTGPGPSPSAARVPGPTTPSAFNPCAR
ncbi:MAG: hypothetical protein M3065_22400 [Actinomycetota bacterium]|nr:hypothetical protein [Actinomycetota bacterium]